MNKTTLNLGERLHAYEQGPGTCKECCLGAAVSELFDCVSISKLETSASLVWPSWIPPNFPLHHELHPGSGHCNSMDGFVCRLGMRGLSATN